MKWNLIFYLTVFCFVGTTQKSWASIDYKTRSDILNEDENAFEFETKYFNRSTSYDQEGNELNINPDDSYNVTDMTLKYSKGFSKSYELSTALNLRKIESQNSAATGSASGLESFSLIGKYLYFDGRMFKTTFGIHVKKSLFSNTLYDLSNPAPIDKVALGDDGLEMGVDSFFSYNDKYFKYDLQLGFNRPSSSLSSELNYSALAILKMKKLFLSAGFGGIFSLKTDSYTKTPALKPTIGSGPSSLYNSINRENSIFTSGIHYSFHNILIGFNYDSVLSGKSTDKGQTFTLNFRYEHSPELFKIAEPDDIPDYFASGFVSSYAKSGQMLRINIGSKARLEKGTKIDIFNVNDYNLNLPIASGYIFEVSEDWSIVKIVTKRKSSGFEVGNVVRAY